MCEFLVPAMQHCILLVAHSFGGARPTGFSALALALSGLPQGLESRIPKETLGPDKSLTDPTQAPAKSHGESLANLTGTLMQIPCQSHGESPTNPIGTLLQIPCQSHGGPPTNPIGALMQIPCQSHGGSLANPIGILYKTFGILHKPMTNHPCEAPASFSATSCSGLGVAKGFLALPQRILTQTPYKSYSNSMGAPCKSLRKPIQIPCKSHSNPMGAPWKPHGDPIQVPYKSHRDPMGIPYKSCKGPNTDPLQIP